MKKVFILFTFIICVNGSAQTFLEAYESTRQIQPSEFTSSLSGTDALTFKGSFNNWSRIMGVLYQFDDIDLLKRGHKGSVFLFDEWNNEAIINVGEKRYRISKINFHIESGTFMSRFEGDSTFVFNNVDIDKVNINKKTYKKYYNSNESKDKFYEVIHENKNFSIIKEYSLSIIEGSPNPMVNRRLSEIKRNENYYVFKMGSILPFKLKEKSVLGLVKKEQIKSLKVNAEKNNLSFKKEADIDVILKHIIN